MRRLLRTLLPPLAVLIVAVLVMEAYVRLFEVPSYLVPTPTAVFRAILSKREELLASLMKTASAALLGYGASAVIGIATAVILSSSRLVQRAFYPYMIFFQTVPLIAIAPMLIMWFDAGLTSVAISAFIVSVFPVIANTLTGLLSTDPALRDMFALYGAGTLGTLWKLRLPSALPNIFTGLRIAAGLAVIGTIVGEFVAGELGEDAGLGILVVTSQKYGNMDVVFAAVLTASVLGLALLWAVNLAGYLALRRWHASEQ
jgi:NitT/TauT family transport system permease protein